MKTKPKLELDMRRVEALAERGLTQEQIAAAMGVSERTIYARKKENAEFAAAIKRGQAKGVGHVANKLMDQINGGNVTAMIFFLKARANWRDVQRVEHTGQDGAPISTIAATVKLGTKDPIDAAQAYAKIMQGE